MRSLIRQFTLFNSCCSSSDLLRPISVDILQCRGRKRSLKQNLSRQQKLERRLKREEREAARKQYTFMEKINIRRMKSLLSPSQQFPGRYNADDEMNLPDKPLTNVFLRSAVKTQFYTVTQAVEMHRELQDPAIFNTPNARLRLRLELNMSTERQTKMVSNSDEIVPVPFPFPHSEKRSILAFVNDPKLQDLAIESGAEMALGPDVIKKIVKGQLRTDDYDFCIAHVDMASYILPLRGILKTRFPTRLNGGLGEDIPDLVEKFKNGVKLSIKGDPVYPTWGLSDSVIGRLNMPDEEIQANIAAIITAACTHRNAALGPFINRALLMTIPGEAHFAIDVKQWLPLPTEEEIEKLKKRQNKKGKKKDEKKVEEVDDDQAVAATA